LTAWELSLIHVNDIHARMEETNRHSSPCTGKDRRKGGCYGGLARIATAVDRRRQASQTSDATLWLNGGDFFQGTLWYTKFKWTKVAQFNSMLGFDAMTLGNHEFDDGSPGLEPFLRNTSIPVVVTNMDTSKVPELEGLHVKSTVLERGGRKIGLVGYLTPDTIITANVPTELVLRDEIESLLEEVIKLKASGVDIIIALGHSGYIKDKEVAARVPDIDIIVGAHSHDFLFTEREGSPNPSNNRIAGNYPTVVTSILGAKVLVLQAFAFTKYLGHIKVNFTEDGLVDSWDGSPILLDNTFPKDPTIVAALAPGRQELDIFRNEIVGFSDVDLWTSRKKESTMGDLITDAMVWAYRDKEDSYGGRFRMALHHSGGIRVNLTAGNITLGGLKNVFPFEHSLDSISLEGRYLRQALEVGVDDWEGSDGGFLQMSGMKVTYNVAEEPGNRVCRVQVLCGHCNNDDYEDLEDDKMYSLVIAMYPANGGDGQSAVSDNKKDYFIGDMDTDVLRDYLKEHSPIVGRKEPSISIGRTCSSTSMVYSSWESVVAMLCYFVWFEWCVE